MDTFCGDWVNAKKDQHWCSVQITEMTNKSTTPGYIVSPLDQEKNIYLPKALEITVEK